MRLGLAAAQGLIYKASPPILPNTGITGKTNSLIWAFIIASKSAYFRDGQCWQKCNFLLLTKRRRNKYMGGKFQRLRQGEPAVGEQPSPHGPGCVRNIQLSPGSTVGRGAEDPLPLPFEHLLCVRSCAGHFPCSISSCLPQSPMGPAPILFLSQRWKELRLRKVGQLAQGQTVPGHEPNTVNCKTGALSHSPPLQPVPRRRGQGEASSCSLRAQPRGPATPTGPLSPPWR